MIKHILKIVWNQRRANGWIFAELLVVVAVLWIMMDSLLVDTYTYCSPMGFDIEDVYRVNIGKMNPTTPGYTEDSLKQTSDGEDLIRLVDQLRQSPQVSEACLSFAGCPYTWSRSYSSLIQAEADTSKKADIFLRFTVSPSYFDVFRIKDNKGHPLRQIVEQNEGELVISADMEQRFFEGQSGTGRKVKWGSKDDASMAVTAVTGPIRQTEYDKSEPCFYTLLRTDKDVLEFIQDEKAQNMECMVRMKDGFRSEDMEALLQGMSDRLTVNNLYVSSVTPIKEFQEDMLKNRQDNMKKKLALVGFMLVNVFFGIVGTFWLRTQYRQGEMGLRTALGSSRSQLRNFMDMEGLSLLAFTIPLVLIFIFNMLYFDMPDTARLPFTWWRLTIAFGGAVGMLAGMIIVGIWFPARKVMKMNPADALHYE